MDDPFISKQKYLLMLDHCFLHCIAKPLLSLNGDMEILRLRFFESKKSGEKKKEKKSG